MRRPLIVGNWKMNLDLRGAIGLAGLIAADSVSVSEADLVVCPPFVYLTAVAQAIQRSQARLGAQNGYHEANGAYTGEISMAMLVDVGCQYVILGHSERRLILKESNVDVNRKVMAAIQAGLNVILCVGEQLADREAGRTLAVVQEQFEGSLLGITPVQMTNITIAYEPVWAIGTGKVATPDQAEEVHASIRRMLVNRFGAEVAESTRIQYGGSVKASNAKDLLMKPNIDGALVGGACLKADEFLAIARAASS